MDFDFGDDEAFNLGPSVPLEELLKRAEEAIQQDQDQEKQQSRNDEQDEKEVPQEQVDAVMQLLGTQTGNGDASAAQSTLKSKRKPLPKLTEEMLVGDKGFKNLVQRTKVFKKRATADKTLDSFMQMIQIWAHELHPAETFKDFIFSSDKVCSKRSVRMQREQIIRESRRENMSFFASSAPKQVAPVEKAIEKENRTLEGMEGTFDSPHIPIPPPPLADLVEPEPSAVQVATADEGANVSLLSQDKLDIIEKNRKEAMAKLALRQQQRDAEKRAKEREDEEARVAKMIADASLYLD